MIKRLIFVLHLITFITIAVVLPISANAENWSQWRGPFLNGSTTEKNLPDNWSKTENVAWVAKMPGPGPSTPIIWGDKVFVNAAEVESNKLWAICLDRKNGQELWKHEAGISFGNKNGNNGAVSSPITDGKYVYFFYGTGDMLTCDMNGKIIWSRNIEKDHGKLQMKFGYGASPLLYKGKLYLAVLHSYTEAEEVPGLPKPMSYLLCIDPKTGKDLWKVERKTDAYDESVQAYNTPYPFESKKGSLIIVEGADCVTAHDTTDGKEVWRWGSINPGGSRNFRQVASVVSADEMVIFCMPRGRTIFALDGNKLGQLSEKDLAWTVNGNIPDVCTPLVMDGKLFVLDGDRRVMTCLNPKTGEIYWQEKLGINDVFQASPTGADGKIYCINMRGLVVVLSAGDAFKVLSQIDMGENGCRSTISVSHGQLFIRTPENLYCIGNNAVKK